ncbi:hypothetical protein N8703_05580, partial [Verrucomicrobia bacterium]|nr:hypothetical protein [Verrucomicrobiota bacterium]
GTSRQIPLRTLGPSCLRFMAFHGGLFQDGPSGEAACYRHTRLEAAGIHASGRDNVDTMVDGTQPAGRR